MYALLDGRVQKYRYLWYDAAVAALEHTVFKPLTPDNADILLPGYASVDLKGRERHHLQSEHLGCFAGGMYALGGRLMGNEEHVDIGRKLTDGCIWAYKHSPTSIAPEIFEMRACDATIEHDCDWDDEKWRRIYSGRTNSHLQGAELDKYLARKRMPKGFLSISDRRYLLRPEAIESVFVLYRITGDSSLLDTAWDMFTAITTHTQTAKAYASLQDVTMPLAGAAGQIDSMESFWFAETLKYFYLIFSDPETISLDEFVFNTETHPLRRNWQE